MNSMSSWFAPQWPARVMAAAALAAAALAGEVITIHPEADSSVDSLVPFPYQGNLTSLAVAYDPTIGETGRSYLRFPLAAAQGREGRISGAVLTVTADYVPSPSWVYVHRSANVTWPENAINFGSQPGFGATVLVSKWVGTPLIGGPPVAHSFNLLAYGNWDAAADIAAGKVTFALRTDETGTGPANVRFSRYFSREGSVAPVLTLTTRLRGEVVNPGFDNGTTGYQTTGLVDVVPAPGDPANNVARLRTSSPASLSQVIDLPPGWFGLLWRNCFMTLEGELRILIDDVQLLPETTAPGELEEDFDHQGGVFDSRSLPNQDDALLTFRLDGPAGTPCEVLLDNIVVFDIPEPVLEIASNPGSGTVTLGFHTAPGSMEELHYQLERSNDLSEWIPFGPTTYSFGGRFETSAPLEPGNRFFRLRGFLNEPFRPGIDNSSFEEDELEDDTRTSDVACWQTTGPAGSWNLPPTQYDGNAPDGDYVAYAGSGGTLAQGVMPHLTTEHRYFLEARVGRRTDTPFPNLTPPDVCLVVDGQKLTPTTASSPTPAAGNFELWQREYAIGPDHPLAGHPVDVLLDGGTSDGAPCEVNFDAVDLWSELVP